jgi:hypothetical protein
MKSRILVTAVVACLTPAFAAVAYAGAQMTLENRIKQSLNLFVDGVYACGPVMPNVGICTTQITAGERHTFEARAGTDPSTTVKSKSAIVSEGASPSWTICYADPNTGQCPGE